MQGWSRALHQAELLPVLCATERGCELTRHQSQAPGRTLATLIVTGSSPCDLAAGFCEAAIAGQLVSMAGPSQSAAGGPAAPWGCHAQRPLPSGQSQRVLVVRGLGESG